MNKKLIAAVCVVFVLAGTASAGPRLKNICRVKGQEENTLRGWGLVVGLNGTGEPNDPPTMRALAQAMAALGNPLSTASPQPALEELKKIKGAALVMVTATVPATGGRRGDHIDCHVSMISGKGLEGGRLASAALMGPNIQDKRVYALCEGQITLENSEQPMVGVVHAGCQLEADIFTPFVRDGNITLVVDKNHADFQTAIDIVHLIRDKHFYDTNEGREEDLVRANDATNIIVKIPEVYVHDPVEFAAEILEFSLIDPQTESRVVVNSKAGTIVISGDVEIGDVIVSHKNVVVEANQATFTAIDADKSSETKLQTLVDQLNALKVPTSDMIEIIKGIERNGKLHGRLIIDH